MNEVDKTLETYGMSINREKGKEATLTLEDIINAEIVDLTSTAPEK